MRYPTLLLILLSLVNCVSVTHAGDDGATGYAERPETEAFIDEMVAEGFDRAMLTEVFANAQYQQSIVDAISRPAERVLTWAEYQDIFLKERRVNAGIEFIEAHRETFARAEAEYGVPTHVIAAIIGVETLYGRITGKYRVIDALSTLAFDYPPRSKFFRSELKQFFLLTREEQTSPLEPLGSYAGAMGYGQFISSSYRHYAVDFDGDGKRDIWTNPIDAIGSVANYLAEHGWQRGEAVTVRASLARTPNDDLFNQSLKPTRTVADLSGEGLTSVTPVGADEVVAPMLLNGKSGAEYWLGLNNFYVITRYNHSRLYAMAVYQLSEQIRARLASQA